MLINIITGHHLVARVRIMLIFQTDLIVAEFLLNVANLCVSSSSSCYVACTTGVRSSKRRHQSPEWTILSHSYRPIQGEVV